MSAQPSSPNSRWFLRSMALTLAVGAAVLGVCTLRPGYAGFAVASTLGFLVAGFLWSGSEPSDGHPRAVTQRPVRRAARRLLAVGAAPVVARSYRVSVSR
jgi:hypothetical protein